LSPSSAASGEHDDRELAGLAVALERAGELKPAHVGQHPVDENQVGALVGERRAGRAAVLGLTDLKARALQTESDHFAIGRSSSTIKTCFELMHWLCALQYYRGTVLQINDKSSYSCQLRDGRATSSRTYTGSAS
jgi:hypothetical protein